MNVALVNKNPAVSRLITLSLNKVGAQYVELDDISKLENAYDCIIIDSDINTAGVDMSAFGANIISLVPRGGKQPEFADVALEKPFLPTEFIAVFDKFKPKERADFTPAPEISANFADFGDENLGEGELENLDELELPKIDELDVSLDNEPDVDEIRTDEISLDEFSFDEPNEAKFDEFEDLEGLSKGQNLDGSFEELGSLVDEIENMQEFSLDETPEASDEELAVAFDDEILQTSQLDELAQSKDELAQIEELGEFSFEGLPTDELTSSESSVDENLGDEFSIQLDEIKFDEPNLGDLAAQVEPNLDEFMLDEKEEILEEFTLNKSEPEAIKDEPTGIYKLKFDEDEIAEQKAKEQENLDEFILDESEFEPQSMQAGDEKFDEFILDEVQASESNLDEFILDETDDKTDENLAQSEPNLDEFILDESEFEPKISQTTQDQIQPEQPTPNEPNVSTIDEIDESAMIAAFGLGNEPTLTLEPNEPLAPDTSDLKAQLREKIAEQIATLLNEGAIKEMLKDMNINVNVSFEEK